MKKNSYKLFCIFFILILFFSCGRKKWPTPITDEDTFKFGKIVVYKKNDCLNINGNIIGNTKNIKELLLEVEELSSCIKCPFKPTLRIRYPLSSKYLHLKHNSFLLTYCKNKGHKVSRLMIVGINKFKVLEPVFSEIIVVKNLDGEK
ncbi:hypothetical protein [Desulfothermus sp.]